jgi:glycosyltransferase involved in cell wall biosynthesis
VIERYGGRVRAVIKPNGGQASAYNTGFASSSGEIICLLDADDIFQPHKVTRVVEILQRDLRLGWCFDVVREFDSASGERLPQKVRAASGKWDVRVITRAGKPPYVPSASSGLSFRRRLIGQIFPMPELMTIGTGSCSDVYLKWISLAYEPGWVCGEELTLMRIHDRNAYTARSEGKKRLRGEIELYTGVCLCEEWPALRKLGTKVFARGLAMVRSTGGLDMQPRLRIRAFLRSLPFHVRVATLARTAAWQLLERK